METKRTLACRQVDQVGRDGTKIQRWERPEEPRIYLEGTNTTNSTPQQLRKQHTYAMSLKCLERPCDYVLMLCKVLYTNLLTYISFAHLKKRIIINSSPLWAIE
jgi:hypothetical protein